MRYANKCRRRIPLPRQWPTASNWQGETVPSAALPQCNFHFHDWRTAPLCHRWPKHFGSTPVPRLSARLPIFFNVVSRARNCFGLASAKTFLISAVCLRKIGAINSLPFVVSDTTRTRRSSGLSTRLTRSLSTRRSTAVLNRIIRWHSTPTCRFTSSAKTRIPAELVTCERICGSM